MEDFSSIFRKYGCDKDDSHGNPRGRHSYSQFYDEKLKQMRHEKIRFLEIGLEEGRSMLSFNEYFTHPDTRLFFCDINDDSLAKCKIEIEKNNLSRVTVFHHNQIEPLTNEFDMEYDIIVDDASHIPEYTLKTFELLKNNYKTYYIVEDATDQTIDLFKNHDCEIIRFPMGGNFHQTPMDNTILLFS